MRIVLLLTLLPFLSGKKINQIGENDILKTSSVSLNFPLYAWKIPSISPRKPSKVNIEPVECNSKTVRDSMESLNKQVKCIPRDTVVTLEVPSGYTNLNPEIVVVKRCNGVCTSGKKCQPSKTRNVEFYVRSMKSDIPFCSKIVIREDTECKCDCPKRKKCNGPNQKYDTKSCKCYCSNKDDAAKCFNDSNPLKQWNSSTCSCKCHKNHLCTTGTEWSDNLCKCIKSEIKLIHV